MSEEYLDYPSKKQVIGILKRDRKRLTNKDYITENEHLIDIFEIWEDMEEESEYIFRKEYDILLVDNGFFNEDTTESDIPSNILNYVKYIREIFEKIYKKEIDLPYEELFYHQDDSFNEVYYKYFY